MGRYFSKFQTIPYAGAFALNLLSRTQFTKETRANKTIFYPYRLKEDDGRIDVLAHKYYKDAFLDWLVFMTNQAIDPYYDLGVPHEQLEDMITVKYGSITNAQSNVAFWRNDWSADDSLISTSAYDALATGLKKYWKEVVDYSGAIIGYERKQEDWVVDTNKYVTFTYTGDTPSLNDIIVQEAINTSHVSFVNSTTCTVKHVVGTLTANSATFNNTGNTLTITEVLNTSFSIPANESLYWSPVSSYDYEVELNQLKRNIKVLDKRLVFEVEREVDELL